MRTDIKEARVKTTPRASLFINRNYALLFFGQTVSLLGDQLSSYTVVLWIVYSVAKGQSWGPLAVSGIMVASILPSLLIGPFAGVFTDRWKPRHTMMRMDAFRAILDIILIVFTGILPLPFFVDGKPPQLLTYIVICCVVFLISICSQFFDPSRLILVTEYVPETDRPHATSLAQIMQSTAAIVGPPLAAPLLFIFGIHWALIIDMLTYVVSFLAILATQQPAGALQASTHKSIRHEFVEGIRFTFSNPTLYAIILTSVIVSVGFSIFSALDVFFLQNNLHASASWLGFVAMSLSIGTILGSLVLGKIGNKIDQMSMFVWSLMSIGILFILLSRITNFDVALVIIFLIGIAISGFRVATIPLIFKETPKKILGRVLSILNPLSTFASLIATLVSGYLASTLLKSFDVHILSLQFGPIDTIFTGVGFLFLLAPAFAKFKLRRLSLHSDQIIAPEEVRVDNR